MVNKVNRPLNAQFKLPIFWFTNSKQIQTKQCLLVLGVLVQRGFRTSLYRINLSLLIVDVLSFGCFHSLSEQLAD